MIEVIPGILEEDEKILSQRLALVGPLVSWVQIDIADATLVTVKSLSDLHTVQKIIAPYRSLGVGFEAHLVTRKPETFLSSLADAGFTRVTAQVECDDPREFIADARTLELQVGLSLDTETDVEVIEPFLEEIDFVVVMGTDVGTKKEAFQPDMVEKIKTIHRNFPDLPIVVEGGMNPKTAQIVAEAGAERIVVSSYLFEGDKNVADALSSFS